jgi:hypothetical protein
MARMMGVAASAAAKAVRGTEIKMCVMAGNILRLAGNTPTTCVNSLLGNAREGWRSKSRVSGLANRLNSQWVEQLRACLEPFHNRYGGSYDYNNAMT